MQKFEIIGKPLLGEKYVAGRKRNKQVGAELGQTQFSLIHGLLIFYFPLKLEN